MSARRARGSWRRPPVDCGGRGAGARAAAAVGLLVVGSACVGALSGPGAGDRGRVAAAAAASDLVSRPAPHDRRDGRRQTTRVARRRRRSRTHRPRAAVLVDAGRCDAVVPRVSSSMSRGRRAGGASEREKKKAAGRDCGARMPPTPVLCGIGCRRAASQPRPPSSAAARPSAGRWLRVPVCCTVGYPAGGGGRRGGGPAVADRHHRACSAPAAADGRLARDDEPGAGESRWPSAAARQPGERCAAAPRSAPGCSCRCKVIGRASSGGGEAGPPGRRARFARARPSGRRRLSRAHVSRPFAPSPPGARASTHQHERQQQRRPSSRLPQPGRNSLPPAGQPAAPPRRPH